MTDHYDQAKGLLRATEAALIAVLESQAEQLKWSCQIVGTDRWGADADCVKGRREYNRVRRLLKALRAA